MRGEQRVSLRVMRSASVHSVGRVARSASAVPDARAPRDALDEVVVRAARLTAGPATRRASPNSDVSAGTSSERTMNVSTRTPDRHHERELAEGAQRHDRQQRERRGEREPGGGDRARGGRHRHRDRLAQAALRASSQIRPATKTL